VATIGADGLDPAWHELGRVRDTAGALAFGSLAFGPNPGSLSGYAPRSGRASATLEVSEGDVAVLAFVRLNTADRRDVEIAGHPGVVGRETASLRGPGSAPALYLVAWQPEPGVVASLQAEGLDEAAVIRAAQGVRRAGAMEWTRLVRLTRLGDLDHQANEIEIGRGTFADGIEWVLRVVSPLDDANPPHDPRGRPTFFPKLSVDEDTASSATFATSGGSAEGVNGSSHLGQTLVANGRHGHLFADGLVDDSVATIEVRSGSMVLSQTRVIAAHGHRGWVVELSGQRLSKRSLDIRALNAAGAKVDGVAVAVPHRGSVSVSGGN
ncbi:MAG TPA: hypothetical protein VGM93_02225, partial [Acidimicrobiales bacterium]